MIDFTEPVALERLADLVADRVIRKLSAAQSQLLVSREELAKLTGLGVRTIDRMAKGGSWERDPGTNQRVWRETQVKLNPIKRGGRVLFDKAAALQLIQTGNLETKRLR